MNEVSKLGQEEEPIEGRIVGQFDGPGGYWHHINEEMKRIVDAQIQERKRQEAQAYYYPATMQALINGEWTYVADVPSGSITYERGPSYPSTADGWWDEVKNWKPEPIEVEFSSGDISDEVFRVMTGYDRNVLIAATKLDTQATVPPVDPEKVKWPHAR